MTLRVPPDFGVGDVGEVWLSAVSAAPTRVSEQRTATRERDGRRMREPPEWIVRGGGGRSAQQSLGGLHPRLRQYRMRVNGKPHVLRQQSRLHRQRALCGQI